MPHKVRIPTEQTRSFSEEPQTVPTEKDGLLLNVILHILSSFIRNHLTIPACV